MPKKLKTLSEIFEIRKQDTSPFGEDRFFYRQEDDKAILNATRPARVKVPEIPVELVNERISANLIYSNGTEIPNVPLSFYHTHPFILGMYGKLQIKHVAKKPVEGLQKVEVYIRRPK